MGRLREIGIREAIIQIPRDIAPAQVERIAETAAELRLPGLSCHLPAEISERPLLAPCV